MDFDSWIMVHLINLCFPSWVNIGADSQGHGLPEPNWIKVKRLITTLRKNLDVKKKDNLKRITEGKGGGMPVEGVAEILTPWQVPGKPRATFGTERDKGRRDEAIRTRCEQKDDTCNGRQPGCRMDR